MCVGCVLVVCFLQFYCFVVYITTYTETYTTYTVNLLFVYISNELKVIH